MLLKTAYTYICAFQVKIDLILYANNEGPDQPAHLRRLIWAFDVRYWIT